MTIEGGRMPEQKQERTGRLCLCRDPGQRVRIRVELEDGPLDVWVAIGAVNHRGQVQLMITAPLDVVIAREEVIAPDGGTGHGKRD
jgi:sRNA-binding carbon storage regulator CsrA